LPFIFSPTAMMRLAARHVHGHRLLQVHVLAGGEGGLEVLRVEVGGVAM